MAVHMVRDSRSRAAAEVRADIETRGIERLAQLHTTIGNQFRDDTALFAREEFGRGDVTARRHHQMPIVIGIAIEHYDGSRPRVQDEPALALSRLEFPETEDAGILLRDRGPDILITPRRPQPQ